MMWGSFGLGISMMMISILLSFQSRGGQLAKSTSSASVTFFFTYMLIFGATANCIPVSTAVLMQQFPDLCA